MFSSLINIDVLNDVWIILGPTAVGKTSLSIAYADYIKKMYAKNVEFIIADVVQYYNFLSIGTGAPSSEEIDQYPHHLLGWNSDCQSCTVYQVRKLIEEKISHIKKRNNMPIIVGGSHFYLYGLFFAPENFLVEHYADINDYLYANVIASKDGFSKICYQKQYNYKIFSLDIADKVRYETLLQNRVNTFFQKGIINEYLSLSIEQKNFIFKKKIIGYAELFPYSNDDLFVMQDIISSGKMSVFLTKYADLVERVFFSNRQYAKKQRTFIRKMKRDILLYNKEEIWHTLVL